jgi:hypothetical protein
MTTEALLSSASSSFILTYKCSPSHNSSLPFITGPDHSEDGELPRSGSTAWTPVDHRIPPAAISAMKVSTSMFSQQPSFIFDSSESDELLKIIPNDGICD